MIIFYNISEDYF